MKETLLSSIRALLVASGAFLIGHHFFATTIDGGVIDLWAGGIISAVGFLWSVFSKEIGTDQILAGVKSAVSFIGGLLVSAGLVKGEQWMEISGVVTALLAVIGSLVLKQQNGNMVANPTNARKLSKL